MAMWVLGFLFAGAGSPSASRFARRAFGDAVRAGGGHPRGHASGDPERRAATAAVYQWPSARVGVPPEGFDSTSCLSAYGWPSTASPLRAFSGGPPRLRYRPRG